MNKPAINLTYLPTSFFRVSLKKKKKKKKEKKKKDLLSAVFMRARIGRFICSRGSRDRFLRKMAHRAYRRDIHVTCESSIGKIPASKPGSSARSV
jgi:hypothetical protein